MRTHLDLYDLHLAIQKNRHEQIPNIHNRLFYNADQMHVQPVHPPAQKNDDVFVCSTNKTFLCIVLFIAVCTPALSAVQTKLEGEAGVTSEKTDTVNGIPGALEKEDASSSRKRSSPLSIPIALRQPAPMGARAFAATACVLLARKCINTNESFLPLYTCLQLPIIYDPSVLQSGPFVSLLLTVGLFSIMQKNELDKNLPTKQQDTGSIERILHSLLLNAAISFCYGAVDGYHWCKRWYATRTNNGTLSESDPSVPVIQAQSPISEEGA